MGRTTPQVAQRRAAGRRWTFGDVILDEAEWAVSVKGRRVAIEQKPMELLHELVMAKGKVLTKDELLHTVWHDVTVVEASLPTAVAKLRKAIGDNDRDRPLIETVSKVGYRLAVPVSVVVLDRRRRDDAPAAPGEAPLARPPAPAGKRHWALGAAATLALAAGGLSIAALSRPVVDPPPRPPSRAEILNAVRRLDVAKVDALLAGGLDPNRTLDNVGSTPMTIALEVCEWNPRHDRDRMMLIVRSLIDAGAKLDQRNVFGDTPYSIAKAPRYCGPDHPATVLIRQMCFSGGYNTLKDKCLALRNGVLER